MKSMIEKRLFELRDPEFKEFHSKLIPNVSPDTVIGVRVPLLKKLAKEYFDDPEKTEFMRDLPHRYYEENQLHIMMILLEKDFDTCISELEVFLPYVDNWAVTDQSSPKCFKKNHKKLIPILENWLGSDHVYTVRYAINIFMREFLDDDFDVRYAEMIGSLRSEEYYLNMMRAWYFATALAKRYDDIIPFIEDNKLDEWTHNKTIQKAIESYRVDDEHKAYLRGLKR